MSIKEALYENNIIAKALSQKWGFMLEGINNEHIRMNTAILLENESQRGGLITEDPVYPGVGAGAANIHGVGTFSGQTANAGGFDFSAGDGTGAGADISPFQHYLLPLVRRVYPNLIANELVGVQPMTSPSSLVFYLKYRYTGLVNPDSVSGSSVISDVANKGQTAPYTEYANFSGNTWSIDPYYSLQTIYREPVTVTAGPDSSTTTIINGVTVAARPVIENTVSASFIAANTATGATATAASLYTVSVPTNTTFVTATNATLQRVDLLGAGVTIAPADVQSYHDKGTANIYVSVTTGAGEFILSSAEISNFVTANPNIGVGPAGTVSYDYNMEGNRQLPEMELQVESAPVVSKTRKLRTKWTIEAAQDLRAMHNIDAEQELIAVLANEITAEIDREIINDLLINAAIRVDYDYSNPFLVGGLVGGATAPGFNGPAGTYVPGFAGAVTNVIPGVTNIDDRNKALFYQILEVSNQIYRQSLRGAGNWIVTSPEVAAKLESLFEFTPDARTDTTYNLGIKYSGTLNGQFKLYKDPLFKRDMILVGFKGSTFMDAGYFYCPYVPLQLTPTVLDTESFNPRKGLITRYGKVLVENGSRMYARIKVHNLSAVGANGLPSYYNGTTPDAQKSGSAITNNVTGSTLI